MDYCDYFFKDSSNLIYMEVIYFFKKIINRGSTPYVQPVSVCYILGPEFHRACTNDDKYFQDYTTFGIFVLRKYAL